MVIYLRRNLMIHNKCACGADAGSAYICNECALRLAREEAEREAKKK